MRKANVYRNGELVGILTQFTTTSYEFRYDDNWYASSDLPPVSLTMPKNKQVYNSIYLFPFFFNMLSEGSNRQLQARHLKIDEKDYFGLLLATAKTDTIGAITISEVKE
ncbi:MAG: HipA N-terminal domain-containing protein [Bacteroidales bacterium]